MGPSSLEQEDRGAASTHMDEGDLFATPSTTIRLSEVCDLQQNQSSQHIYYSVETWMVHGVI
jgi:hypothetical protein